MLSRYVKFKCTKCSKTRDIKDDGVHLLPNQCVMTRGCQGTMLVVGSTTKSGPQSQYDSTWVTKNTEVGSLATTVVQDTYNLNTSAAGAITIAIRATSNWVKQNTSIVFKLVEKKIQSIDYVDYTFNLTSSTSTISAISGRDSQNRVLRFNPAYPERISVFLLGAEVDATLWFPETIGTVCRIRFEQAMPAGNYVIRVYAESPVAIKTLDFESHKYQTVLNLIGSWGNVSYVKFPDSEDRWYLYSTKYTGATLGAAMFTLDSILADDETSTLIDKSTSLSAKTSSPSAFDDVRFLFAVSPYTNMNRIVTHFVSGDSLASGQVLSVLTDSVATLNVSASSVVEIFPSISIINFDGANDVASDTVVSLPNPYVQDVAFIAPNSTTNINIYDAGRATPSSTRILGEI